jgi:hypothetical protein
MAPLLYFPRFIYIKKIKIKAAYGVRMGGWVSGGGRSASNWWKDVCDV